MPSWLKRVVTSKLFFALVCLGLVLILNVIMSGPNFFTIELTKVNTLSGALIDILRLSSQVVILAMGMTVVASCSAGADISVGSVMVFSMAVALRVLGIEGGFVYSYAVPLIIALLVCVIVGAICGVWNGFLVSKLKVQPMVATLILFIAARAAAKVVMGTTQVHVEVENFKWLGLFITDGHGHNICPIPTPIFIAIAVVLITALVFRYTALGTNIQSVGINARASRIIGMKSTRILWMAFVFCGACAGIAGMIMAGTISTVDAQWGGRLIELDAILAVALGGNSLAGGKFSIAGSVVGAITIQALKTGLGTARVTSDQIPFYQAIVVVIIVVMQSPELRPMVNRAATRLRGLLPQKVELR